MGTNILLIIIIVLLALILFIQIFQFIAVSSIPEQFIDAFFEFDEAMSDSDQATTVDVPNLGIRKEKVSSKGFDNLKKSKGLNYKNYKWSSKKKKNSTELE